MIRYCLQSLKQNLVLLNYSLKYGSHNIFKCKFFFENINVLIVLDLKDEPFWLLNVQLSGIPGSSPVPSIQELMQDGILWGVPKKRPTVERRMHKRFGVENYPQYSPILRPRNDLVVCERCGDHHETFTICRTCYMEVKEETDKLKKEIKEQTDPLQPKERELLLRYEDDKPNETDDHEELVAQQNKFQFIDVARPRPNWFSRNLMLKSVYKNKVNNLTLRPEDTIDNK